MNEPVLKSMEAFGWHPWFGCAVKPGQKCCELPKRYDTMTIKELKIERSLLSKLGKLLSNLMGTSASCRLLSQGVLRLHVKSLTRPTSYRHL